jgi:hypothetical protein
VLDKINASLIPLLFKPFVKSDIAYPPPPPLGDICVLSVVLALAAERPSSSDHGGSLYNW